MAETDTFTSFYTLDNEWECFCWDKPWLKDPPYQITGKYLFFSPDREQLREIATRAIKYGGFHMAKVVTDEARTGDDYVLCLYYRDDSRKHELARRYRNVEGVRYRYWKADADTLDGVYSVRYRSELRRERDVD